MKLKAILIAIAMLAGSNVWAGGGGLGNPMGATLPEQLVQSATQAEQLVRQATMVQQQLNMLQNQARNLASLPSQMWPGVAGNLNMIIQISRQAHALAYSGGDMTRSVQQMYGNTSQTLSNASQKYQSWTDNSNQQLANTLQSYGYQSNNFASEQDALAQVQAASQSATGRLQALQAGNAIAGMQVNQMQMLRSAVMDGNAAILTATATQANISQQEKNIQNDFMNRPNHHGW